MRNRHHAFEFFLAILEIDRIEDRLALAIRQRQLDRRRIGGIDHHRCLHFSN